MRQSERPFLISMIGSANGEIRIWWETTLSLRSTLKRQEHIANARELLARLAHNEGSTTYWNLEANTTPFYGWGTAGRLETTALAVEALAKLEALGHDPALAEQVNRGLQYLLTHKDRYACWYSTQATQNVIEAMIAAMPVGKNGTGDDTASVLVNGTKLADIKLPKATEVVGPRVIDFGKELMDGQQQSCYPASGRQQCHADERDHELLHTLAAIRSNSDGELQVRGHKSAEIESGF